MVLKKISELRVGWVECCILRSQLLCSYQHIHLHVQDIVVLIVWYPHFRYSWYCLYAQHAPLPQVPLGVFIHWMKLFTCINSRYYWLISISLFRHFLSIKKSLNHERDFFFFPIKCKLNFVPNKNNAERTFSFDLPPLSNTPLIPHSPGSPRIVYRYFSSHIDRFSLWK